MYFDIGANIGKWSLENMRSCSKIIAIEASPTTYSKLVNSVGNNKNIVCLNYAVCDSDKEYIDFYNCSADTLSTLNRDWLDLASSRFYNQFRYNVVKCKTITLDKLIELYGRPELIKIDVEGGEFQCLSSLTQKVPNICFEWASETNNITFQCLSFLEKLGYTEFAIQYEDNYTYRPQIYRPVQIIVEFLNKTTPKKEWGMIWAK
jgi:FkbM family methyltransferase